MTTFRTCSECGEPLTGKGAGAKTCSTKCRSARSRRLKRIRVDNGKASALPEHLKDMQERVRGEVKDETHRVIQEELRPVVREALTEDTLKAIRSLVGLTSRAVAAIEDDLASEDAVLRQKAYTLLMKYTVGHGALVQPPDQDKSQAMTVNFNLPRPETVEGEEPEVIDAVATEQRQCDTCNEFKDADQFVANSDRCSACFAALHQKELDLLSETDG